MLARPGQWTASLRPSAVLGLMLRRHRGTRPRWHSQGMDSRPRKAAKSEPLSNTAKGHQASAEGPALGGSRT